MNRRLRDAFHDGAAQVEIVPMAERARRAGDRLGHRRTAVAGATAAVTVLALVGGWTWFGAGSADAGASQAANSTSGCGDPIWTPDPDAARPVDSWSDIPSIRYYGSPDDDEILRVSDDTVEPVDLPGADHAATAIAPDGSRVAVTDDCGLWIGDVDTGELDFAYPQPGLAAARWSPDGAKLLIPQEGEELVDLNVFDLTTGELTKIGEKRGPAGWTADAQHVMWTGDDANLVAAPDGSGARTFDGAQTFPDQTATAGFGSTSADLRFTCEQLMVTEVASGYDEPGWCNFVADNESDTEVDLPVPGELIGAWFAADGRILVRTATGRHTTLTLLAADHDVLDTVVEPEEVAGRQFMLTYR